MSTSDKMKVMYQGQRNTAMENAIVAAAELEGFALVSNEMDFERGFRVLYFSKEESE